MGISCTLTATVIAAKDVIELQMNGPLETNARYIRPVEEQVCCNSETQQCQSSENRKKSREIRFASRRRDGNFEWLEKRILMIRELEASDESVSAVPG